MGVIIALVIVGAIVAFALVRRRNIMLYGQMREDQPIHYDNPVYREGVFGSGIKDLQATPGSSSTI